MYSQIDFPSLARSRDVEKIRNFAPVPQMTSAVFIRDKKQLMSRVDIICGGRKKNALLRDTILQDVLIMSVSDLLL